MRNAQHVANPVREISEMLERCWSRADAQLRIYADAVFYKTASLGDVDLWTRPLSDIPDASKGLSYVFVSACGELVDGFSGERRSQQVHETTVDCFLVVLGEAHACPPVYCDPGHDQFAAASARP